MFRVFFLTKVFDYGFYFCDIINSMNKVKITVRFRGRELNNVKLGEKNLNQFIEALEDIATPEKKAVLEGKNMFIILARKPEK